MSEIEIRKYKKEDFKYIEKIHNKSRKIELKYANLENAFVPLKIAAIREDLFKYNILVAIIDKKIVGFISYLDNEIGWLYVDKNNMNKKIGENLIKYVLDYESIRPIYLEVLDKNIPAINLYKKMGFIITKTCEGKMPGNEEFNVKVYIMKRK